LSKELNDVSEPGTGLTNMTPDMPSEVETSLGESTEQTLALGRRVGSWKTLISFLFAILILVIVVIRGHFNPTQIWERLHSANWGFFFLAFVIYYTTFPLRGYRWQMLLRNAYRDDPADQAVADMHVSGLTEIIFISWFVNCLVPAKLGDLYRAYLAKLWQHISWLKVIGTVLAERIIDILMLAFMLASAGLIAFHSRLGSIKIILALGVAMALVGLFALLLMKRYSPVIRARVPARFRERYIAFEDGTLLSLRRLPLLFGITVPIWLLEGLRLQFVFAALHVNISAITSVPFAAMLFFALGTAVLTTLPFTPGGLGLVETGLAGVMILLGLGKNEAGAVVFMDRLLSYYSIAILGFIVYLVSKRSHFRHR
jgi:uncharacterized protein (TIRG00374 family)